MARRRCLRVELYQVDITMATKREVDLGGFDALCLRWAVDIYDFYAATGRITLRYGVVLEE